MDYLTEAYNATNDHTKHEACVQVAKQVVTDYQGIVGGDELEATVADLIGDLMHLLHDMANAEGDREEFIHPEALIDNVIDQAYRNYRAEV